MEMLRKADVTKTYMAKKETVEPQWFVTDAEGQIVGRMAVRLATILMGKHKPIYTPHVDCGDFVVVVNAEKIRFSGPSLTHKTHPHFTRKMAVKEYDYYTGYPGGRRVKTAADMLERRPEFILTEAVRRMLPKNRLGRQMLKKLKVYAGGEHPHQAQQPGELPEYLR